MRLEIKANFGVSDTGEITGTAWPFGTPDRVGDIIEKGAFGSSVSLPMLHEHNPREPLGVWTDIRETDRGLEVKGQLLVSDVQRASEVHALVKAGAITGLSIGFQTKKSVQRSPRGRSIKSLDLHEISLVAVPCHTGARIATVKSNSETSALAELLSRAAQTYRK